MTGGGLIIAAPNSGAGKTTVTLGVLAALRRKGIAVKAAKAGPDYIDPAFHAAATGIQGFNLDTWAMPPSLVDALVAESARGCQLLVIEGVMGLFDGVPGPSGRTGAAADLAARFALPVILVLDVGAQAQSAAAVVRGFSAHDANVVIAGVILNRLGSERHRSLVSEAIAQLGVRVIGALPREQGIVLPERHLGLVQASEHADLQAHLERLADMVEQHVDLDALLASARPVESAASGPVSALPPPGQRIALAADAAFTFIYPHLLASWRKAGAEIAVFSPLADEPPPETCDVCWLPGGYPELHAGTLAAARRFHAGLARFAQTRPVHGECGGYMVLGEGIEDAGGVRHAMTGLLGHSTSFAKRKLNLGYREARVRADSPIGLARTIVRGHEFHYATLMAAGSDEALVELADAQGRDVGTAGGRRGHVTGTFFHAIARKEME
jgi:cobyrinic acid a,c-diamide synthase